MAAWLDAHPRAHVCRCRQDRAAGQTRTADSQSQRRSSGQSQCTSARVRAADRTVQWDRHAQDRASVRRPLCRLSAGLLWCVSYVQGGSKVQEAKNIYQELAERFNWTVRPTKHCQCRLAAAARICMGNVSQQVCETLPTRIDPQPCSTLDNP